MNDAQILMAGIYIHIPFCKQACHYCDFHFSTNTSKVSEMVGAIQTELRLQRAYFANSNSRIDTIYFGGGTPSLLSLGQLESILKTIRDYFIVDDSCEITLEANPDDMAAIYASGLKQVGVNRLSIGVQSFSDEILRFINRAHDARTAHQSIEVARDAGFDNVSIDLIYAIPGLSTELWHEHLEAAIAYRPEHISAYSLTLEPGTVFGNWLSKNKLKEVDESLSAQQFELLMARLEEAGYQHYEISNFCKPGSMSRHNSSYWNLEPYLGVGPSAHSFNLYSRQFNIRNNAKYLKEISQGTIPCEVEILSIENQINEFLLTKLRTAKGCDTATLKTLYHYDILEEQKHYVRELIQNGLMLLEGETLKLTSKGKLLADKIASDLFLVTS
ncbi:MAG: radical SAM family heme chaperone HemW [Cyclobacteriaceae bacterium]